MITKQLLIQNFEKELFDSPFWKDFLFRREELRNKNIKSGSLSKFELKVLYNIIRNTKPETVIETGVRFGGSSAVILQALKMNSYGELISIDHYYNQNKYFGFYVNESIRNRWTIFIGKTIDVLPTIKRDCDIFIHDSAHTYKNMYFEYNWAKEHLTEDGLLMSHDIYYSDAWEEFVNENKFAYSNLGPIPRIGIIFIGEEKK